MADELGPSQTVAMTDATVIDDLLGLHELLVVSNRQPYRHSEAEDGVEVDRPTGGLTAGLDPVMQRTGGTWIAWGDGDGDTAVVDGSDCVAVPPDEPAYQLRRVWLSKAQVTDYYYGFCNQVLWPICHSALTRVRAGKTSWERYREVNEQFAEAVTDQADGWPLVWFHDYHLGLAPAFARSSLPDHSLLMQFWHIPWPSWDVYRATPHRRALLEGLLANDLLAFHVPRYRRHFLRCIETAMPEATVDRQAGEVTYGDHVTTVTALPMGVDVARTVEASRSTEAAVFWEQFRRRNGIAEDTRVGVGVDRLDYTKGLTERLRALEQLWVTHPGHREAFTFVQNASESRSRIPAYRAVQERVADEVTRINQRFGTDDWTPIVYLTDRLATHELSSLYRHADLCVVSPVRDGLNLVAQEYVAAQLEGDGVLLLSDQAGVHDVLGEDAVSIRPTEIRGFAGALARALSMPANDRRHRMERLRSWVVEHDLESWLEANFRAAIAAGRR